MTIPNYANRNEAWEVFLDWIRQQNADPDILMEIVTEGLDELGVNILAGNELVLDRLRLLMGKDVEDAGDD